MGTFRTSVLALAAAMLLSACGGSDDTSSDAATDAAADATGPGGINQNDAIGDTNINPPGGCIGAQTNPVWKEQYGPFCQSVVQGAQASAPETTCILIDDNPTANPCYCAECGLRGVDYLCFREVCD